MFAVFQFMSQIFNSLILILNNFLVMVFGLLMTTLFINNMFTKPFQLFFGYPDPFIYQITRLLNISGMLAVGILEFGQLDFVYFGVGCLCLYILDEVSAGK